MKAYFVDLDGTLSDSRPGLYHSFHAGLSAVGVDTVSDEQLLPFLGTPLPELFRAFRPDISQAEIDAGMQAFRSVYETAGLEYEIYPGVPDMMASIRRRGRLAWIVTSKPELQAIRIVRHAGLDQYVEGVIGAGPAELDTKTDLVARALAAAKVPAREALMLGDRHYDVVGALANNVLPVGALWGYGSREELQSAGCRHFAQSPRDFQELFVETDAGLSPLPAAASR